MCLKIKPRKELGVTVAGTTKKKETVETLKAQLEQSVAMYIADYRGLSVKEITELRGELYAQKANMHVVKNTLMRRAADDLGKPELSEHLSGPTAIVFSTDDPVGPVKTLRDYFKKNKKSNELRGGILDDKVISSDEVAALADLPSIEELRGKLVGSLAAPGTGLVAMLSGPGRGLVQVLDQFAKQKQATEG